MFCPNCGQKLKESNQRFCHSCGSEISTTSEAPKLEIERSPYESTTITKSTPEYTDFSVSPQKPTPVKVEGPGSNSIKCFIYAMTSMILFVIAFVIGFNVVRLSIFGAGTPFTPLRMINIIIVIILHIAGLIFGIVSKTNAGNAERSEPENALKSIGGVFGVIGIILNAIFLVIFLILAPIMLVLNILRSPSEFVYQY
jgi:hypothetical protein